MTVATIFIKRITFYIILHYQTTNFIIIFSLSREVKQKHNEALFGKGFTCKKYFVKKKFQIIRCNTLMDVYRVGTHIERDFSTDARRNNCMSPAALFNYGETLSFVIMEG